MEVGQPAAPAPPAARLRRRSAALDAGRHRLHRSARHCRRCGRASRVTTGRPRASTVEPDADRGDHRIVGRLHPGISCAVRAGRPRRGRLPGLSALPAHPHRARLRTGADRDFARRRAGRSPAEALRAAHRRTPLKGVLVASPANPTGTMMRREALAELIAVAEGEGIRVHLGRDLSRARLRIAGRDRGEVVGATR